MKLRLFNYFRQDGRWIPLIFVGMFAVIFLVNGIMITIAFSSWTGLTTEHHYLDGLAYNERLAAAEAQAALGWQVDVEAEQLDGQAVQIRVSVDNGAGKALAMEQVTVAFVRPTHDGYDFDMALTAYDAGRFAGSAEVPLPGVWDLRITAHNGVDGYQKVKRIMVRPQ